MKTKKGTHLPYRPFTPENPLSGFTPFKLLVWYYTATQINPAVGASFFFVVDCIIFVVLSMCLELKVGSFWRC